MKARAVIFAPEARDDLMAIYKWIDDVGSPKLAIRYVERIEAYCLGMSHASERGRRRDDVRPGMRAVGFERRATIAFKVEDDRVTILRIFHGGRNWEAEFA
ncbi:type II toxin-antitoxin system RelE/ParE family toxin [Mesorhizobium sp. LHD-90]|uniref:type II toxin-antitoxin system RelE/ParE family toxin n=1 Tax=Mesorhizobium sp. LHD-90 TaxID=3071414 RepID=UPI0027E0876F|nr:type II toxin-antitoxin system RelE/ParE family toxin [Mesorhizobium sp. LHD-90]MDQ6435842.1 type II toxin-antitoxin system RelE/ParE family toxin [Mesorhizobium sp. LHD-90]